jgi:cytochrome P450
MHHPSNIATGPETLSINNHAAVETVYAASQAWDKSKNYRLGRMRGIGMFFMQDRQLHHSRRRHYWGPALGTRALVSYEPLIDNLSNAFAVTLQERAGRANGVAEMSQVIQHWSHDLSVSTTFLHVIRVV